MEWNLDMTIGLITLGILIGLYLMPALIAHARDHHNATPITILNIALGWSLLGWIAALIWATTVVIPRQQPLVSEILPPQGRTR